MLRLSPSAQTNTATGKLINYISVDVGHLWKFCADLGSLVYCPIMVASGLRVTSLVRSERFEMPGTSQIKNPQINNPESCLDGDIPNRPRLSSRVS